MPSTKEIWDHDLELLIRQKSFEMLSVEERASVLMEVEAQEYRRLRETAMMASQYLGGSTVPLHLGQRSRNISTSDSENAAPSVDELGGC